MHIPRLNKAASLCAIFRSATDVRARASVVLQQLTLGKREREARANSLTLVWLRKPMASPSLGLPNQISKVN